MPPTPPGPPDGPGRLLVVEHEDNAGIGLVGRCAGERGWVMDLVGPNHRSVPEDATGYAGVVVLGGTPGPRDDAVAGWLPAVRTLVASCLDRSVPLLGICLGAQLLAVVAGGRVAPAASGPEIGVVEVGRTEAAAEDPLLRALPGDAPVLAWHHLEVVDLPPGSRSLAATAQCANQAFRVGPVAWGVQFHLEAGSATARAWARDEELAPLGRSADAIVAEVRAVETRMAEVWSAVARRWLDVVAAGADRADSPAG